MKIFYAIKIIMYIIIGVPLFAMFGWLLIFPILRPLLWVLTLDFEQWKRNWDEEFIGWSIGVALCCIWYGSFFLYKYTDHTPHTLKSNQAITKSKFEALSKGN